MIADHLDRRNVLKALALMPLLPAAPESQASVRTITLGNCPTYAAEVAYALRDWPPSLRSALYQLGDRCLTVLTENNATLMTARLNNMARDDFFARRVLLAGGWLVSVSEAAIFTRLDAVLD